MEKLKYRLIRSEKQYDEYCRILHDLVFSPKKSRAMNDEIDLLDLLIEKYDEEHSIFSDPDPVRLLKSIMADHKMKAVDLAKLLKVSEGLVSDMLNYKKGFSKESIRILSDRFKLRQEAFNRPYILKQSNGKPKNGSRRLNKRRVVTR